MRYWQLLLFIFVVSSTLMAKAMCLVPIDGASGDLKDNAMVNNRLKTHQKIKSLRFDIDLETLQSDKNKKIKLVFETIQAKKFETSYNFYNKTLQVWKVDFSTSQIFPQLLKNYMNITQYNSKYYLRLYDSPSEKSIVNLIFDSSNCKPSNKSSVLSRVDATRN
ncbi:MAG: hypothetical protein JNL11_00965 [Bdellovibrionaceae bacterium]|nr:hypothetical protein [Pseudobdellovibrionaceae bacterium]